MTNDMNVKAFCTAYCAGNEAAKTMPENKGLYQLAQDAGHERGSLEWDAFIAGGAAFLFQGQDLAACGIRA